MAKINLLPWREELRREKKKEFLVILGGVVVLSALVAFLWVVTVESAIENQNARNQILETEISSLEKQVAEISELKKKRDDLLTRIKIIQDLQGTRSLIVRYFDDLARAIPDGVYLTLVSRKDDLVSIEGVAESYNRVASFMRSLDKSDWFAEPSLTSVVAAPSEGEQAQAFKMTVKTSIPGMAADQENADNLSKGKVDVKKSGGKK